jgi:hypothetical protein
MGAEYFFARYPGFQWSYALDRQFTTQLPKNIAMIRAVVALVLAGLALLKLKIPLLRASVAVVGILFALKTVYDHFIAKDSLVELFCKHLPNTHYPDDLNHVESPVNQSTQEVKLRLLPQLIFRRDPHESFCRAIQRLNWEDLDQPLYRTTTSDGRNVFIIKEREREGEGEGIYLENFFLDVLKNGSASSPFPYPPSDKRLYVYIERFGPFDILGNGMNTPNNPSKRLANIESAIYAIFHPFQGNTFFSQVENLAVDPDKNRLIHSCSTQFTGTISSAHACELFAQLQQRSTQLNHQMKNLT